MKFLFLLLLVILISCSQEQEFINPEIKDINEAVYASGKVKPVGEFTLTSLGSGYIEEIFIEEGDTISYGEPILNIKNNTAETNLQAAQEALRIASENLGNKSPILRNLFNRLEVLKRKFELDSLNFVRYTNLYKSEAIAKTKVEQAEIQMINTNSEIESVEKQIEQRRNQLSMELENAKANYTAKKEHLGYFELKSSVKGRVYKLFKNKGEFISQGTPIALMGSADSMYVELKIDETDLNKVELKQTALLNIDVIGDTVLNACIKNIKPIVNSNDQTVTVDAFFDLMPSGLYSGLNVEANILIRTKKDALVIPREYIFSNDSVMVLNGKKPEPVKVETGIESDKYIEILSGLDDEDKLVK